MAETIQIQGLDRLNAALQRFPAALAKRILRYAIRRAGAAFQRRAKAEAPRRTGELRRKIYVRTAQSGATVTARVGAGFPGRFVQAGTRPHEIRVSRAFALASRSQIFGRVVHHPGARPNPFMARAWSSGVDEALTVFRVELASKLDETVREARA